MKSSEVRGAHQLLLDLHDLREQARDIGDAGTTARIEFYSLCGDCVGSTDDIEDDVAAELRAVLGRHLRERIAATEAVLADFGVEIDDMGEDAAA